MRHPTFLFFAIALPFAVANMDIVFSNSTAITLQWVTHKKTNIWYTVGCSQCKKTGECREPCEDARYDPGMLSIKGDSVTVAGLEPATIYEFRVYSVNELNKLEPDKEKWMFKSVTRQTAPAGNLVF